MIQLELDVREGKHFQESWNGSCVLQPTWKYVVGISLIVFKIYYVSYQTLIIEASLEYQGDGWLGYNQWFLQRAAVNLALVWANIDTTIWNLAFARQASASHCCHCFCLSHTTDQCNWAPEPQTLMAPHMTSYQYLKQRQHFDPQFLIATLPVSETAVVITSTM